MGRSGSVTDAFLGVGVPGTSIFEPAHFADFLHIQCAVTETTLDATGVAGTIDCTDLGNGDCTRYHLPAGHVQHRSYRRADPVDITGVLVPGAH